MSTSLAAAAAAEKPPLTLTYRSLAFTGRTTCTPEIVREATSIGYNDFCFHTEHGNQTEKVKEVRKHLQQSGILNALD